MTPVAGGSLSPSVVFGGIPSTVSIAVENPNATYDANLYGGMSYYVEVVAQDASGATIIGSDPYATPIALTSNGNFGAGSTLSVTSPSQTVFITTPASGTSLTMHAASPAASIIATCARQGSRRRSQPLRARCRYKPELTATSMCQQRRRRGSSIPKRRGYLERSRLGEARVRWYRRLPRAARRRRGAVGFQSGGNERVAIVGFGSPTTFPAPILYGPILRRLRLRDAVYLGANGLCDSAAPAKPASRGRKACRERRQLVGRGRRRDI